MRGINVSFFEEGHALTKNLKVETLIEEAHVFCDSMYGRNHVNLIGVTDGKAETVCTLRFLNCTFVDKSRTADFTITKRFPPQQGYLTISNALQWRLQYSRVLALKNSVSGVVNYER